ncbi:hypothetical protein [Serratia fonticola]
MTLELAFQISLGLVAALGGMWLRHLQSELKELRKMMELVQQQYQRRDDAQRDNGQVMELLREVKRSIERIDGKLDRKADKKET